VIHLAGAAATKIAPRPHEADPAGESRPAGVNGEWGLLDGTRKPAARSKAEAAIAVLLIPSSRTACTEAVSPSLAWSERRRPDRDVQLAICI
jgi:hypothetical protein